ncbi:MAG: YIP1 family protein [Chloroflexota bacterium]
MGLMKTFFNYLVGTVLCPRTTFGRVRREVALGHALAVVLLYGALYTAYACLAFRAGVRPVAPPVLPISEDMYYLWEAAFAAPVIVASWLVYSTLAWAVARALGGEGSFRAMLSVSSFSLFVPQLARWACDALVIACESEWWGTTVPLVVLYPLLTLVWTVALGAIAAREAQRIPLGKALVMTLVAVAVTIGFAGVFLR